MVQMPCGEATPADMGEIISPGWAFLEVTMPPKGARMMVHRAADSRSHLLFGHNNLGLLLVEPRFQGEVGGFGAVVVAWAAICS